MCSGNAFVPPRDWNHELHNLVGCDHVSIMARRLDAFLEDFMLHHHYNRRASDPQTTSATIPTPTIDSGYATSPLKPFRITRRMREDAAKEPRGETITFGPASPITFPQGCHKPDFLGHEQHVPVVDPKAVERVMDFARDQKCAEVKPCDFKFFTRPGYCTGFWVRQHGRQVEHFENESDAKARCDFLNRVPQADAARARRIVTQDLESCLMRPNMFTETDGTDGGKTLADCFAKGGIANLPETTFGGFPVAAPIDLPPVEAKPRVRGLSSIRRSWRMK